MYFNCECNYLLSIYMVNVFKNKNSCKFYFSETNDFIGQEILKQNYNSLNDSGHFKKSLLNILF